MRIRRRMNPKHKPMTPEQEQAYADIETELTGSRIIERGVAAVLNTGDFMNTAELQTAVDMLQICVSKRKQADSQRSAVRKFEQEAEEAAGLLRKSRTPRKATKGK